MEEEGSAVARWMMLDLTSGVVDGTSGRGVVWKAEARLPSAAIATHTSSTSLLPR